MRGFPLPGLLRQVAEGHRDHALEMLELAERDMRDLLAGEARSNVFNPDTDPVTILVQAARQLELCEITIKLDDEAKKEAK